MKILLILIVGILILEGCGKKSDPKYQSEIRKIINIT
jgi:hypothetical protein